MSLLAADEVSRYGILDFPCGAERLPSGNTIIADAGDERQHGSEILEVDPQGQIVWAFREGLQFPHSVQPLANGNLLVTDTTNNRVVEIDRENGVVFDSQSWSDGTGMLSDGSYLNYPNDAHETTSGTLLITDRNNNRCVEVNRKGQVIWQFAEGLKHPHNADPLENGNVIIADSDMNRVIEVDKSGKIVWSYGDNPGDEQLSWPRDADRLPSGTTLICDSKNARLLEVNHERKIVWQFRFDYFANLYDADLLENGNLLVTDQQHQRVVEIDRFGNVIWIFRNFRYSLPIYPKLVNGSFKRWSDDGAPEGWSLFTRTGEGGGRIARAEDDRGNSYPGVEFDRTGGVYMFQLVAVEPGRRYKLGARLRTEDMSADSVACLQFAFRDSYGGLFEDVFDSPKGELLTGETDWFEDSLEAEAPDGATSVELRVLLTGPGKVWIRRMMMLSM